MNTKPRKKLAVWKFASCDGCQLSILNLEDEVLLLAEQLDFAYFPEASSATEAGPYDLSLVEGSVTTAEDQDRILDFRRISRYLVTIGACATAGGIQALRNFGDIQEYMATVYAKPEYIQTLARSWPISALVAVDYELRGCPINKQQLLEVMSAYLLQKRPAIADESVCTECKRAGYPCVLVAQGKPCLGPVTHAGCEALCPRFQRGCYGCYGPKEQASVEALGTYLQEQGETSANLVRLFRNFNAAAAAFARESERHERNTDD